MSIIKNKRKILTVALSVVVSVFCVSLIVYGATTVGTNVTTTGTLTVSGATSLATASTTGAVIVGGDAGDDNDIVYFDAKDENITWDDANSYFSITDDWVVTGYASTTVGLYTQGTANFGGNATTSQIYLPRIKFQQGVVTSTGPSEGECFMPNNDFTCYVDGGWVYAW